jgi:hypothetical protein
MGEDLKNAYRVQCCKCIVHSDHLDKLRYTQEIALTVFHPGYFDRPQQRHTVDGRERGHTAVALFPADAGARLSLGGAAAQWRNTVDPDSLTSDHLRRSRKAAI